MKDMLAGLSRLLDTSTYVNRIVLSLFHTDVARCDAK